MTLYAPKAPRPELAPWLASLPPRSTICLPPAALRPAPMRQFWRTFRLGRAARRDGVSLYHGLSHEMPRDLPGTGIPGVVTFHDLLFERHPELFPAIDRMSYGWRYRWSAEHAAAIVAVSGQTRDDLVKWYGVDPQDVTIIPPARDPAFARPVPQADAAAVRSRLGLPATYLLSVGTLERRKNHRVLVDALALLDPHETPALLLVGRDGGEAKALRALAEARGVAAQVRLLPGVASADLPAVYQGASLFLYPSLFEGFGMPIVEALSAGVPVITSAGGCFPEAGGPSTRYVTSTDASGLAAAMRDLLDDPELAARMRDDGRRWSERFDATALAAPLLALYHSLLR
ncbi:MAG: mannosyltransferase [Gemmatimonadetes bacterium]|nr:mannosyltransferase [Gemmatimonadota bacterium]